MLVKLIIRKPLLSILNILLLSIGVCLCCIGQSVLVAVNKQKESIVDSFTTIAVPVTYNNQLSDDNIAKALQNSVFADLTAQNADQVKMVDRRVMLSAHLPGSIAMSTSIVELSEYNMCFDDETYSLALFALECNQVELMKIEGLIQYDAEFTVIDIVSRLPAYNAFPYPNTIHIYSQVMMSDGSCPFQTGKQYLVFGQYHDYFIVKAANSLTGEEFSSGYYQIIKDRSRYLIPYPEIRSMRSNGSLESALIQETKDDLFLYYYPSDYTLSWFAEYNGDIAQYLNSKDGQYWTKTILPIIEVNHESATILLTDAVPSIFSFNQGVNYISSGRQFVEDEYEEGINVCLVSAAYAELNNWQIGDQIELEYYSSGLQRFINGGQTPAVFESKDPGPYRTKNIMLPESDMNVHICYTIVGLFTGPRFSFGSQVINADTIIVPRKSVPFVQDSDLENYYDPTDPLLNSFVLKNGTSDSFEAYMTEQGYPNQFVYLDQEYTKMEESLQVMDKNATRLCYGGVAAAIISGMLFLFTNMKRMRSSIRSARLTGVSQFSMLQKIVTLILLQSVVAVLWGSISAIVVHKRITQWIMSESLNVQTEAVIKSAIVLFLAVNIFSAFLSYREVHKGLMIQK